MQELKNSEKALFAKLRKRELICSSIQGVFERLEKEADLADLLKESTSTRIMLRNINQQILAQLKSDSRLDETLLVSGIEFRILVEIDQFEFEYLNTLI